MNRFLNRSGVALAVAAAFASSAALGQFPRMGNRFMPPGGQPGGFPGPFGPITRQMPGAPLGGPAPNFSGQTGPMFGGMTATPFRGGFGASPMMGGATPMHGSAPGMTS